MVLLGQVKAMLRNTLRIRKCGQLIDSPWSCAWISMCYCYRFHDSSSAVIPAPGKFKGLLDPPINIPS